MIPGNISYALQVVIIKLDAVGDVLRTTSILPSIKEKYPKSHITWLTKTASREILKDNKLIDKIYFIEHGLVEVTTHSYDIAFNLDSGRESCSQMNKIKAKQKFGYGLVNSKPYPLNELANEWYLMGVNDNSKKANTKSYHRIIHEICGLRYSNSRPSLAVTQELIEHSDHIRERFGLNKFEKFILVNLGGGNRWQYKKWTKEGYSSLVNKLSSSKNLAVGVIAGDEDRTFYSNSLTLIENNHNIIRFGCDNTTQDFISIIYLADKIFTSDSLAFHIATAFGKYTVGIVGPTSREELDVFGNGKIIFSGKVDCLSCYLNTCDKKINCMNTVSAEEIMSYLV